MFTLASSVHVYNAWRIALHASSYRSTTLRVTEVHYHRTRRGAALLTGAGVVDGVTEKVGLADFVPKVSSQAELESSLPINALLNIWYDPTAADVMTQGVYLRILPGNYPIQHAWRIALLRTLGCNALLILGFALPWIFRRRFKTPSP